MCLLSQSEYVVSISKEQLATLPAEHCRGKITVIDKASDAVLALRALRREPVVGFDTETRPTFKRGQTNEVSLLQLSGASHSYLFRLNLIGLMKEIKEFLEDPDIVKVGLSIKDDFHNLNRLSPITPQGFIDLQQYVKRWDIADNSLAKIYGVVFGKRISKGQRLTNWEASHLSEAQQAYAALDALACIDIYNCLQSGEFVPSKSAYYHKREEDQPQQQKQDPEP